MPKKEEYKEPELIIDGQKVKFHYNRAERLAMKYDNVNEKKNCFFCLKNRGFLFILADFTLIFLIFIGYYYFIGKSKGVIRNNFYYNLSVKRGSIKDSLQCIVQIKNMLNKKNTLLYNDLLVELYDRYSNPVNFSTIMLDKLEYEKKEFNTYSIDFNNLQPEKYRVVLKNRSGILVELDFRLR